MARKRSETEAAGQANQSFPAERIIKLLYALKSAISMAETRALSLDDLEQLTGRPAGTIGSWFDGVRMHQVEFLFSLLERLPRKLREELVETTCRIQPNLRHPALAHDPLAVSQLDVLLRQRIGFTAIRGSPEHARAFVLNALGNSAREVSRGQQPVTGVELQCVSSWAPVPGVIRLTSNGEIRRQIQVAWAAAKEVQDGGLVLLGGIWGQVAYLHPEIVHLAARCHVIIADPFPRAEELPRRLPEPAHILTVAPAREQPEWFRVTVQRQ